ncbi:MAG: hypothetical protein BGP16_04860 [Sphingobium sp. 66-54]|nr:MAG: hypothetical protein BGP16_04860 [Sphingobium sp. 66-54]
MSVTRIRLARTGRMERHVIQVLRGGIHGVSGGAVLPGPAVSALHALARQACAVGYDIMPVDAAYLSASEATLLGWLAYFQREEREQILVDSDLIALLRQAAGALATSDHRLPYQVLLWADRDSPSDVQSIARQHPAPPLSRLEQVGQATVRARAIAHTRAHGRVSTGVLRSLGISRQYLSQLCLKGALVRVGHGFYEAPPNKC